MAENPLTGSDTLRALNGQPTVEETEYAQSITEALQGIRPGQDKSDRGIVEALNIGQTETGEDHTAPVIGSGTMTASESGRKWLSDLAIEAADSALGNALMHKHPGMTAGLLSAKAQTIIGECYADAAKRTGSEIERLDFAAEKAKRIAQELLESVAPKPAPVPVAKATEAKAPAEAVPSAEAKQPNSESPVVVVIESLDGKELSRRRLTNAEAKMFATRPNGSLVIEQAKRIHDVAKGHVTP